MKRLLLAAMAAVLLSACAAPGATTGAAAPPLSTPVPVRAPQNAGTPEAQASLKEMARFPGVDQAWEALADGTIRHIASGVKCGNPSLTLATPSDPEGKTMASETGRLERLSARTEADGLETSTCLYRFPSGAVVSFHITRLSANFTPAMVKDISFRVLFAPMTDARPAAKVVHVFASKNETPVVFDDYEGVTYSGAVGGKRFVKSARAARVGPFMLVALMTSQPEPTEAQAFALEVQLATIFLALCVESAAYQGITPGA